jgi:hypothetical protein
MMGKGKNRKEETMATIQYRLQQCFCSRCRVMEYDACTLKAYVGEWKSVDLKRIAVLTLCQTLQAAPQPRALQDERQVAVAQFFEGAIPSITTIISVGLFLAEKDSGVRRFRLGTMTKRPYFSTNTNTETKSYKDSSMGFITLM